jgi:hypothetical protein
MATTRTSGKPKLRLCQVDLVHLKQQKTMNDAQTALLISLFLDLSNIQAQRSKELCSSAGLV